MISWNMIQDNAVKFSKRWESAEYEKGEAQSFLNELFSIFGVDRLRVANFEYNSPKSGGRKGFIDLFWKGRIIVEMKSAGASLDKAYTQAKDYAFNIKNDEDLPKLIMVCDFKNIRLYNLITGQIFTFKTKQLSKHVKKFTVLTGYAEQYNFVVNKELNNKAAEKMAKLHELLESHGYDGHYLKVYLVRLLFLLFSDNSGIFEKHLFRHYVSRSKEDGSDLSSRLFRLFDVVNTSIEKREKRDLLIDELKKFVYINGSLFEESIPPADFDNKMRELLLECCAFDWSTISPAIFGSLFQGVMDKKERRNLGAHYTSEENILKLIKPLFLDNLYKEFEKVKAYSNQLDAFHKKISNLKFLDPACGCGNFLIIAYRELRLLELEVLKMKFDDLQRDLMIGEEIKVNVDQFYGIEYEEFPSRIAQVAMWLMDHQMNNLVAEEFGMPFNRLPLKNSATINQGNALKTDWNSVVSNQELDYIIGNPPFIGASMMTKEQKKDAVSIFGKIKLASSIDYVGAWYHKAAEYAQNTSIRGAFVSTNSICQGEQVKPLWDKVLNTYKMKLDFAYRTFKWNNEAKGKAAVHCVIIGFSSCLVKTSKFICNEEGEIVNVKELNPYLLEAPNILVESRSKAISDVARMVYGNKPSDDGNLILTETEREELIKLYPDAEKFIHPYIGSVEFINNKMRYCIWLKDVSPAHKKIPGILNRIKKVKEFRLKSSSSNTREKANYPDLFFFISQPTTSYLMVPRVSSNNRRYLPIGFMPSTVIASDSTSIVPNATLYHFGILTSNVHNAWMKHIGGRLKSDYRYSGSIVYNTFPWPKVTDEQIIKIEKAAQAVLDTRKLPEYSDCTMADLYNEPMPEKLMKAHKNLDKEVCKAYGLTWETEEKCAIDLMKMYRKLIDLNNS